MSKIDENPGIPVAPGPVPVGTAPGPLTNSHELVSGDNTPPPYPDQEVKQEVEPESEYLYTTTCCNKKRPFCINFTILMVLSFHIGFVGGMGSALVLTYLNRGMSVANRAVMNFLAIPMLVNFNNRNKYK